VEKLNIEDNEHRYEVQLDKGWSLPTGPHYFTERNGPEHLTISRNGTDGTDRTLKKANVFRLSVLQRHAHEYEASSEEFNCLSCTYHNFTHLRS